MSETSISPDMSLGSNASRNSDSLIFSVALLWMVFIIGVIASITRWLSEPLSTWMTSVSKSRVTMASNTAPDALCFNDVIAFNA